MPQRRRWKHAAGQFKHLIKRGFVQQLVASRPAHHAVNRDLGLGRRNLDGVTGFETLYIASYAMQQKIVQVELLDELFPAIVSNEAQRTARSWPAGDIESIQRSRERVDIVSARIRDV